MRTGTTPSGGRSAPPTPLTRHEKVPCPGERVHPVDPAPDGGERNDAAGGGGDRAEAIKPQPG